MEGSIGQLTRDLQLHQRARTWLSLGRRAPEREGEHINPEARSFRVPVSSMAPRNISEEQVDNLR